MFEAKDRRLSKPQALQELDRALEQRSADFAVLVVPTEEEVPAKLSPLREYNGDKLIVALDPEGAGDLALELGYRLARARVLMQRSDFDGVDAGAIRGSVERALQAMDEVRRVKGQLTERQDEHRRRLRDRAGDGHARARPPGRDRRRSHGAGERLRAQPSSRWSSALRRRADFVGGALALLADVELARP